MGACLSCGKQLGSLKQMSASDQFCSEAHRLSYQAESNRLALDRLQNMKGKSRRSRTAGEDRPFDSIGADLDQRSTLVLDPPSADAILKLSEAVQAAGEDVVTQEPRTSRYSVAPPEASAPVFPVAGAIGPEEFLYAAGDETSHLRPVAAPQVPFETAAAVSALEIGNLDTLGYDDPDLIEAARAEFGLDEGAYVPVEPEPPAASFQKLQVEAPKPVAPADARMMIGFEGVNVAPPAPVAPSIAWEAPTLRSRMVRGKNPNPLKPAAEPSREHPKPVVTVRPAAKVEPAKPAPSKLEPAKPELKAAPHGPETPKPELKVVPAPKPQVKPEPEKPRITVRPASEIAPPPKREEAAKPAAPPPPAAADTGAPRVEKPAVEAASAPAEPAPKPKESATPKVDAPKEPEPFSTVGEQGGLPPVLKGGIAAVAAFLVLGGGYYALRGSKTEPNAAPAEVESAAGPAPASTAIGGGWTSTWGSVEPVNRGKQISIYRPTVNLADYRMEFRGQIDRRAMGWIFRAKDPNNYHVQKLEIMRPGREPVVALVKYSIIDGKEGPRTQVMLARDYKRDTVYRVRVDVKDNRFTTWVQDKLVDYWTDDRIKFGAAGFYNDRGERANIKTSQFTHLD